MKAAGLQLIAVGIGEPKHAVHFCGRLAPSLYCLTDKDAASYREYGLQEGDITQLLNPNVIMSATRAFARGHVGGRVTGNTRMLPGTFIVDRQGIIRYAYYGRDVADHPPIGDLLTAARAVQSASRE
ncbi:hypothetical protein FBR02_16215 [Anaerolineae bacterium CFX9]|nr:hypothetical protein [Anaerolineae bacterium CFX9]